MINTSEEKLSPVTAIDMNDQSHNEMEDDITFTPITIESDLGGDIDVMEGSLMSMLENFRSGKMTICMLITVCIYLSNTSNVVLIV